MRILITILVLTQTLIISQVAFAQATLPPALLTEAAGQVSLNGHIQYLEDKEGILTIDEVAASNKFINAGEDAPNFGFTQSVYWFRFAITNQTKQKALLLEQGYTHIDAISLFVPEPEEDFVEKKSGDMLSFKNRARAYRTITFELQIEPGETQDFFIRTQTSSSMQLPLHVYTESTFAQVSERESTFLGAFYGIILVMIVFNALLWLSLRDKTYLNYVGYLTFYLLSQLALNGNAFRYLFPESPYLNTVALPFSMFLGFFFGYRFTRDFMNLETILPKASLAVVWVERILLGAAFASIWIPYSMIIKPAVLVGALGPLTFLVLSCACLMQGYKPAKTYLTAWSFFIFGMIIFSLKTAGILPANVFTEFSIQVGSALEVTLLSLALADRIHILQADRELALAAEAAAHYSLAESYEALHVELERRKVAEGDLELELKARGHLVAEAAHRLNNPLHVSLGGISILQERLQNHIKKLENVFTSTEPRTQEEEQFLSGVNRDLVLMQDASNDSRQALQRANDFLDEFRAVGGLSGSRNRFVSITSIIDRAKSRILADAGKETFLNVQLSCPVNTMVWSNEYVAALLLSYCVNTMAAHHYTDITIVNEDQETPENPLKLILRGKASQQKPLIKDLLELSPVQLSEAVGNKSPTITEDMLDSELVAYRLTFSSLPPKTHMAED